MVLGEAATPERLAARALEISEARRVHEHHVERGQQVAPASEQLLLHDVLHAARRKRRRAVLFALGQFLAEPGHGAIEMMQFEALDALDAVILAPAVGGAIRAAAEEAMQHGQERRALQREIMLARARQALDHAPAARLLPHPLEGERRPDAPRRDDRRLAAVERVEHDRLVGEARARAQQPLQLPALLQILDPAERGDHLLAHRRALAPALDDLEIGAAAGGLLAEILVDPPQRGDHLLAHRRTLAPAFDDLQIGAAVGGLAEIHGGEPRDNSILVRTAPARTLQKSTKINARRGTTLSQLPPIAVNNINELAAPTRNRGRFPGGGGSEGGRNVIQALDDGAHS